MQEHAMTPGGLLLPKQGLKVGGYFEAQIVRNGEVVDEFEAPNMVVNQGLTSILDVYFRGTSSPGAWYIGLFQGNYTPVATVTAAQIASASNETSDYDEPTRPQWQPGAVSAMEVSNSANRATFTFNASRTLYGAFMISSSTKGGTAGVLAAAARFGSSRAVASGDQLLLTYSVAAAT